MAMVLRASRLRWYVTMLCGVLIGNLTAAIIMNSIIHFIPLGVGSLVGVAIAALLIPIKKYNVVLDEDKLRLSDRNWLAPPIEVPMSEIDLSKSRIGRFGEGRIMTIDGDEFVISTILHSKKNIRQLFEEIQNIQKQPV